MINSNRYNNFYLKYNEMKAFNRSSGRVSDRKVTKTFKVRNLIKYGGLLKRDNIYTEKDLKGLSRINAGGKYAYGFLAPNETNYNNKASAKGHPWTMNGYDIFAGNKTNWVRGHLMNGDFDGSGSDWKNLVILSGKANAIHKTSVEQKIRNYLNHCAHKAGTEKNYRGIFYLICRSTETLGVKSPDNSLFYAPKSIACFATLVDFDKPNYSDIHGYILSKNRSFLKPNPVYADLNCDNNQIDLNRYYMPSLGNDILDRGKELKELLDKKFLAKKINN